jgi:FKBP-type peptidyl-prolyl cis-trans isomerase
MFVRSLLVSIAAIGFSFSVLAQDEPEFDPKRGSYAIGYQIGTFLKPAQGEFDMDLFVAAVEDAMNGVEPADMTEEELARLNVAFQQHIMAKPGKNFLAENAEKDGVKTLPSGLQYKVITEGTGATPTAQDSVLAHYRGTFIDGTQFDSSHERGEPATFGVSGVIAGWTEALQLMKEGAKWELYIPYTLAYGPQGRQGIPPYSTLLFEVELIKVNP